MMQKPEILYKYRPCDKYNSDIILRHRMFFPRPATFNDPFDCRIPLVFDGTIDDWRWFLRHRLREAHPEWPNDVLGAEVKRMIESGFMREFERDKIVDEMAEQELERMEILCLCEPRDDILMWSHYADSHRGVCLGFGTSDWVMLQKHIAPVEYVDEYPVVNALTEDVGQAVSRIAFTKDQTWSYEKEWRAVRAATASQMYSFPPKALREIIFGSKVADQDRLRLIILAERSQSAPRYFQAVRERGKFKLRIIEFEVKEQILREALEETDAQGGSA